MARPLASGKQSVDLATAEPRVSKIRRDPPAAVKEIVIRDRDEHNRRNAIIGIITFALAIFVILLAFTSYAGWSPRQYTVEI